jgi:hypothetical protein
MNELTKTFDIDVIEEKMLAMPQADCPLMHKFDSGHYIREVRIPAGAIAIGHHQNFEHINIFIEGKVLMLNDDGTTTLLEAPMTFIGKPGRKIGFIVEDVLWQNVYKTDIQDIMLLEQTLLTKTQNSLEHAAHKFAMLSMAVREDQDDYVEMIAKIGYTEDQVQVEVQNLDDQIPLPYGEYKVTMGLSAIHGHGIFATSNIAKDELVGPARIDDKRTPLGRYTNHAKYPNCRMEIHDNIVYLVANYNLVGATGGQPGQELTVNYTEVRNILKELTLCQA